MNALDATAIAVGRASRASWIGFAVLSARRSSSPRPLLTTIAVAFGAEGLSTALRRLIARPRPCRSRPALIPCPRSASFPSNHAAIAAASALTLARFEPRFAAPLVALAGAVAASRVHVGVHHPSDVVAGAIVGVGVAALATL
jgi:undecaprenyl-diphosphatase